jgi:replicative DNA helicase
LAGVSTGLTDLDRKLGGLHPSDLLVLAGRPAMGKTALATNIAFHVATSALDDPSLEKQVVGLLLFGNVGRTIGHPYFG